MHEHRFRTLFRWSLWLALVAFGAVGLYLRLTYGHRLANYGSYIPWGLWVACYIYFVGMSAGLFVIASVVLIARTQSLLPMAPLTLLCAVLTLVMALLSIGLDLGHMNRAGEVMLHANLHSMMAWMIFLYSTYMVVLLVESALVAVPRLRAWRDLHGVRGRLARLATRIPEETAERWLQRLGIAGIPLAIAFSGGVGALFATVGARPYWNHGLFPIIFLAGALLSGAGCLAAVIFVVWPRRDETFRAGLALLGRLMLYLLIFDTILEWAEFSIPMWQGISHEMPIFHEILYGRFWASFWIIHLLLGVAVPVVLLWRWSERPLAVAVSGALVAVTFISVRLNIVIPPLTIPLIEGLDEAYVSPRLDYTYFPSWPEWAVLSAALAIGSTLFWAAVSLLPILPARAEGERS
jgi:molybdopterin-containing oxidoreductase family membrane subunit